MPLEALDLIFRAMRGRRVWQPLGVKVVGPDEEGPMPTTAKGLIPEAGKDEILWEWVQGVTDWVGESSGLCLTGYLLPEIWRGMGIEMVPRADDRSDSS